MRWGSGRRRLDRRGGLSEVGRGVALKLLKRGATEGFSTEAHLSCFSLRNDPSGYCVEKKRNLSQKRQARVQAGSWERGRSPELLDPSLLSPQAPPLRCPRWWPPAFCGPEHPQ